MDVTGSSNIVRKSILMDGHCLSPCTRKIVEMGQHCDALMHNDSMCVLIYTAN